MIDAIFNSMGLLMVVLHLLQLNDEKLTHLQLIGMARGVASGMAYLSAMNFIHRVMKIFCLKYVEFTYSNVELICSQLYHHFQYALNI